LLTIEPVRHLLGRRSEAGFLAEVARNWAHLYPGLPHQARPAGGSAGCGASPGSSAFNASKRARPAGPGLSVRVRAKDCPLSAAKGLLGEVPCVPCLGDLAA
jgi:hypothetical protein